MATALPYIITAIGAVAQGSAQSHAANVDAANAETNAAIARQDAKTKAEDIRKQGIEYQGAAKAGYGVSGVQQTGSVTDVLFSSAYNNEVDAQRAIYQGEAQAVGFQGQAATSRAKGSAAMTAGIATGASSIVAGYSKANPPKPTQTVTR